MLYVLGFFFFFNINIILALLSPLHFRSIFRVSLSLSFLKKATGILIGLH